MIPESTSPELGQTGISIRFDRNPRYVPVRQTGKISIVPAMQASKQRAVVREIPVPELSRYQNYNKRGRSWDG
jgi:hypothetical protein